MSERFIKLDLDILSSSINQEPAPTFKAWVTCLILAAERDWKGGTFRTTDFTLAARANIDLDEARAALSEFLSADPSSSSPELDGQRLERLAPNDYRVINWEKYQDSPLRQKWKLDKRRQRASGQEVDSGGQAVDESGLTVDSVSVSVSSSSSSSSPKNKKGVVRGKKAGVVPEYTDAFEAFWEQTWKRGHKRAAFDSWATITESEDALNDIVIAACEWTSAFERRPADKRPHVSTWLNNRGWEDDLDAELAKAKDDVRQVGKTPAAPKVDENLQKRRKQAVKCINTHASHLMEVEADDDQAGKIIRKAAKELVNLGGETVSKNSTIEPMKAAEDFGKIHDQMLNDLFHTLPEEVKGGVDPEKSGYANEEAFTRSRGAFRRKAAREFYDINDINDYDWGE